MSQGPRYFSVITATQPGTVGKAYALGKNGKMTKSVIASITAGHAVTIEANSRQSGRGFEAYDRKHRSGDRAGFFHRRRSWPAADQRRHRTQTCQDGGRAIVAPQAGAAGFFTSNGKAFSARLKRLMSGSGWILVDADNPPAMPPALAKLTLAERLKLLEPILPGISKVLRIEYRGSSARVINGSGNQDPTPTHALLQISNPELLDRLRSYIQIQVVLQGLSFKAPKRSKVMPGKIVAYADLTIVDLATWVAARLVFNTKPDVSKAPGFRALDADIRVVNPNGGILDISWIKAPDATQVRSYAVKTNRKIQIDTSTGGSFAIREDGALDLLTEVEARGAVKTLAEWLVEMYDRDLEKMRCQTPFRDSISEAALIRIGGDGSVFVFDSGTSTKHFLAPLPSSEKDAAAQCAAYDWYERAVSVIEARARQSLREAQAAFAPFSANPTPNLGAAAGGAPRQIPRPLQRLSPRRRRDSGRIRCR